MIRAFIFDIDDTLIATSNCNRKARREAVQYLFGSNGRQPDEEQIALEAKLYSIFGWSKLLDLWRAMAIELACEVPEPGRLERAATLFDRTFFDNISLFPTVEHTLQSLVERGVPIGIISNGDDQLQRRKLQAVALDRRLDPDRVFISIQSDFYSSKPASVNFRRMEDLLALSPQELAYVGDKPMDIVAANVAGWRSIRTRQALGGGKDPWPVSTLAVVKPDHEIAVFSEILEIN